MKDNITTSALPEIGRWIIIPDPSGIQRYGKVLKYDHHHDDALIKWSPEYGLSDEWVPMRWFR